MAAIGAESDLEERLGEFAIPRSANRAGDELLLEHHERVQAGKPPQGKRPWFEPLRNGWVVRASLRHGRATPTRAGFVHPVRVAALRRFLEDTAT